MSLHLSDATLADALFGSVEDAALEHLRECPACAGRLAEAEEGLTLARRADVPEPPPLYWEALRRNVGRRIADEPRRASWIAWLAPVAAAAGLAAVVIARGPVGAPAAVASPTAAAALPSWSALPPLDEDEAVPVLEGVVAVAGTGWDEGKGPDEYVAGLSEDEQSAVVAALARPTGIGEEL